MLIEDSQLSIEKDGSRTDTGLGCRQLDDSGSISSPCNISELMTHSMVQIKHDICINESAICFVEPIVTDITTEIVTCIKIRQQKN